MTRRRKLEQQVAGLETARRLEKQRADGLEESLQIARRQHQQASERAVDLERQLAALQARYDSAVELDHPDIAAAGEKERARRATVTTLQERGDEREPLPRRTPRTVYDARARALAESALRNSA